MNEEMEEETIKIHPVESASFEMASHCLPSMQFPTSHSL
jgi:hypothetical protein